MIKYCTTIQWIQEKSSNAPVVFLVQTIKSHMEKIVYYYIIPTPMRCDQFGSMLLLHYWTIYPTVYSWSKKFPSLLFPIVFSRNSDASDFHQKFPEMLRNFLKMHIYLFFCTWWTEQSFQKSGNFLKTGISESIPVQQMLSYQSQWCESLTITSAL